MYSSVLIFVLLCFADSSISQELSSQKCQITTVKYCRPNSPRIYRVPHYDYRGNGRNTAAEAPPGNLKPTPAPTNTFEDLAQNLFAAESAIRKYCLEKSVTTVKEAFGILYFEITYYHQNVNGNEVVVRIKNKVIYVTVEKFGETTFTDLRILPSVVNPELATWTIENGNIVVKVPYITLNTNISESCNNVNDTLINVPKSMVTVQNVNSGTPTSQPVTKVSDEKLKQVFGSQDGAGVIDIRFQDN